MLDVGSQGWCGYTWPAVVQPARCNAKFSEMPLETARGREMNSQFTSNCSGEHPQSACQLQAPSKTAASAAVLCDRTAHFKVALYGGQLEAHLCNNHAV